jgi:hypothetical protein
LQRCNESIEHIFSKVAISLNNEYIDFISRRESQIADAQFREWLCDEIVRVQHSTETANGVVLTDGRTKRDVSNPMCRRSSECPVESKGGSPVSNRIRRFGYGSEKHAVTNQPDELSGRANSAI